MQTNHLYVFKDISVDITGYTETSYFPSDSDKKMGVGMKDEGDNIEVQMKIKEGAWGAIALSGKDSGCKCDSFASSHTTEAFFLLITFYYRQNTCFMTC